MAVWEYIRALKKNGLGLFSQSTAKGQGEIASSSNYLDTRKNIFPPEGVWALELLPREWSYPPKAARAQVKFGQCSQTKSGGFGVCCAGWGVGLDPCGSLPTWDILLLFWSVRVQKFRWQQGGRCEGLKTCSCTVHPSLIHGETHGVCVSIPGVTSVLVSSEEEQDQSIRAFRISGSAAHLNGCYSTGWHWFVFPVLIDLCDWLWICRYMGI